MGMMPIEQTGPDAKAWGETQSGQRAGPHSTPVTKNKERACLGKARELRA